MAFDVKEQILPLQSAFRLNQGLDKVCAHSLVKPCSALICSSLHVRHFNHHLQIPGWLTACDATKGQQARGALFHLVCLRPDRLKEEVLKIRNKIDVFAEELQGFCHEFREKCPFDPANAMNGEYDLSYETMNEKPC